MGTVVQELPQINPGSQPRWDRFERADLFEQYREWRTQGLSERQLAKALGVPRPPYKPGGSGTTASISALTSRISFTVAPDWRSYTDSSLLFIWSAWKWGPVASAWFVSFYR